jgi:hypothetical protein
MLIIGAATGLRLWKLGEVALLPDEAYYWLWSLHPAPSYLDHPAGIALLIRLSTMLGGSSEIGIRWFNAGLGIGCVILLYLTVRSLYQRPTALLAAAIMAISAPYMILSRFVYPDTLLIFALLLNVWILLPVLVGKTEKLSCQRALAAGFSFILLVNTKYTAYGYVAAVLIFVLFFRPTILHQKRAWGVAALTAMGFLPVLIWNIAHDWISFRWQFSHIAGRMLVETTFLGRAEHAVRYLTWPLLFFVLLAIFKLNRRADFVLILSGFLMMAPALIGPVDSPRNLAAGICLWIAPAADLMMEKARCLKKVIGILLISSLLFVMLLYGIGTTIATFRPFRGPQSSSAAVIRRDAAGWRDVTKLGLDENATLFTIDYSIASQLSYYSGRCVFTSWWQYRHWGKPPLDNVQILSLAYVDPTEVSLRMREAFDEFSGPERRELGQESKSIPVFVWSAQRPIVDVDTFLDLFDFFSIKEKSRLRGDRFSLR